jgi:phage gpG-like protein
MAISVEIENLAEVQRNAEDVAKHITDGSLVARAGYIIERQAKQNASGRPGPRVQTGRLRASITTEVIDSNTAKVGTNVVYAAPVEFGHLTRVGRGARGGSTLQPFSLGQRQTQAYPFLGPTIEQTKDQMTGFMVEFGKELGEEWSK